MNKKPIILGAIVQMVAFLALVYLPSISTGVAFLCCFLFGFANASHMLAFSTAADVVKPNQIGTSAAIVNGIMFIVGGIMISRPGPAHWLGIEAGMVPKSHELAQYAARPSMRLYSLAIAFTMRETFPE